MQQLHAGQVVHLDRTASPQFVDPVLFRVIRVDPSDYDDWWWLTGYQLDGRGEAVEKRSVFVQLAGIRPAAQPAR